ncbi:MAG: hypothetical protein Q4C87_07185 [Actinomycetaceae bacterium]|nr:hypothetical protein [Actinomycetaceae bacterium]
MSKTSNIDTDKLRTEALQLRDAVAVHAGRVAVKAADLAEQGIDWAAPRAQAALESAISRATPIIENAADRASDAADKAKPLIADARERVVEDYIPRLSRAVEESGQALQTEGTLLKRADAIRRASTSALATPTVKVRRKRRFLRALGWTAATAAAAGVAYLVWKRSQPIEDPWAEEYWADLESDTVVPAVDAERAAFIEDATGDVDGPAAK